MRCMNSAAGTSSSWFSAEMLEGLAMFRELCHLRGDDDHDDDDDVVVVDADQDDHGDDGDTNEHDETD